MEFIKLPVHLILLPEMTKYCVCAIQNHPPESFLISSQRMHLSLPSLAEHSQGCLGNHSLLPSTSICGSDVSYVSCPGASLLMFALQRHISSRHHSTFRQIHTLMCTQRWLADNWLVCCSMMKVFIDLLHLETVLRSILPPLPRLLPSPSVFDWVCSFLCFLSKQRNRAICCPVLHLSTSLIYIHCGLLLFWTYWEKRFLLVQVNFLHIR